MNRKFVDHSRAWLDHTSFRELGPPGLFSPSEKFLDSEMPSIYSGAVPTVVDGVFKRRRKAQGVTVFTPRLGKPGSLRPGDPGQRLVGAPSPSTRGR